MWDGYKDETSFYKFHSALKLTHHRLYLFIIIKKLKQGNFYEENSSIYIHIHIHIHLVCLYWNFLRKSKAMEWYNFQHL